LWFYLFWILEFYWGNLIEYFLINFLTCLTENQSVQTDEKSSPGNDEILKQ
jgi:hypothetical protein